MKQQPPRYAQNSIDYIIYSDPKQARRLLDQYGYAAPGNVHQLVQTVKRVVRRKGKPFIRELLEIHPDRKALLSIVQNREAHYCHACSSYSYQPEGNYCGTCGHSAYTGPDSQSGFLKRLAGMGLSELETLYQNIVAQSNKEPQNQTLSEEVRLVWNELRTRKKDTPAPASDSTKPHAESGIRVRPKDAMLILALTLVAGGLIGSAWKFKQVNA